MFRLQFLVLMSSCQPCLIWREKLQIGALFLQDFSYWCQVANTVWFDEKNCKLRTVFTVFFQSNDNLMIWGDDMIILKLIIPRIWRLNWLKNMISDINGYLVKALLPRNHFQIWFYFIVAVSQIFLVLILNSKLRGLPVECVCALWLAVQQNTVLD